MHDESAVVQHEQRLSSKRSRAVFLRLSLGDRASAVDFDLFTARGRAWFDGFAVDADVSCSISRCQAPREAAGIFAQKVSTARTERFFDGEDFRVIGISR